MLRRGQVTLTPVAPPMAPVKLTVPGPANRVALLVFDRVIVPAKVEVSVVALPSVLTPVLPLETTTLRLIVIGPPLSREAGLVPVVAPSWIVLPVATLAVAISPPLRIEVLPV